MRNLIATLVLLLPLSALAEDASRPPICPKKIAYPPRARELGREGKTVVGFIVRKDGTTTDVHIISSSGADDLDQAALAGVMCAIYKPAMRNGEPVDMPWQTTVRWRM